MSLPIKNLDDRTFQELVDEAKRKIPQLCPQWTNHNVSDPGVALIELFAWLTEMAIFRLNQVPDVFYTRMLNLLGFRQFPAKAATVDLVFWLTSDRERTVEIPAATEVSTVGVVGDERIFSTVEALKITTPTMVDALTQESENASPEEVWEWVKLPDPTRPIVCFTGENPKAGACLYLGFDESLSGRAIELRVKTRSQTDASGTKPEATGTGIRPPDPPIVWEISTGKGWVAAETPKKDRHGRAGDTTGGLNRDGEVLLLIPPGHAALPLGETSAKRPETSAFWLRVKLTKDVLKPDQHLTGERPPVYAASPQLLSIDFAVVGGIARAEHAARVHGEVLGFSDGKPDQVFRLRNSPVLDADKLQPAQPASVALIESTADAAVPPAPGLVAVNPAQVTPVGETPVVYLFTDGDAADANAIAGETATESVDKNKRWRAVESFANFTVADRVYTLDTGTGEVRFGPQIRYGSATVQHGAVPPAKARIEMVSYRHGGGNAGNVGAGTLTRLRQYRNFIAGVTNPKPATGGVDAEGVEDAKLRGPHWIRAGERAVTSSDFVRIAREVYGVARAHCTPRFDTNEPVGLLIVPEVDTTGRRIQLDDLDLTDDLFQSVKTHLDTRRLLGTTVEIRTPYYQGVSVAALVHKATRRTGADDALHGRIQAALEAFIDPIVGGPGGTGWPFEVDLTAADVAGLIESIDGVAAVEKVVLFDYDVRRGERLGFGRDLIKLDRESLFMSGQHRVVVR